MASACTCSIFELLAASRPVWNNSRWKAEIPMPPQSLMSFSTNASCPMDGFPSHSSASHCIGSLYVSFPMLLSSWTWSFGYHSRYVPPVIGRSFVYTNEIRLNHHFRNPTHPIEYLIRSWGEVGPFPVFSSSLSSSSSVGKTLIRLPILADLVLELRGS